MTTKSDLAALAAQAIANGARVQRIEPGVSLGLSARDWRHATSDEGVAQLSHDQREETRRQAAYEAMLHRQGVV
jgi:hypothetical protein